MIIKVLLFFIFTGIFYCQILILRLAVILKFPSIKINLCTAFKTIRARDQLVDKFGKNITFEYC